MKGSSGAKLRFSGDFVLKECVDAREQCEWFSLADSFPRMSEIRFPAVDLTSDTSYRIEFVEGTSVTKFSSTRILDALVDQVLIWSKVPSPRNLEWGDYLTRLFREHVSPSESEIISKIFEFLEKIEPFPSSFSHGDLTLENALVDTKGSIVLIDPNFKENLFQSYILDLGKLLQSVHSDYHRVFNSHPGADPAPLCEHLRTRLGEPLWSRAIAAEMSHLVRLRKYQPEENRPIVDRILEKHLFTLTRP